VRGSERLRSIGRGHLNQGFHYRSADGWATLLETHGLQTRRHPIGDGTPFANVLIEGRLGGSNRAP
jgi:hypothetical protein